MAPNLLLYPLLLVALVLMCLMVHVWWPGHPTPTPRTSLKPSTPRHTRSTEPKPFTGYLHKPLFDACQQGVEGLSHIFLALKGDNADRGYRYPPITWFSDTPR
jgi:hypothetical protein